MPSAPQPFIAAHGLQLAYGNCEALRGLSLTVSEGAIFGLLGPNGSGKTSFLECVLGLRRPDSGSLQVAGFDALTQADQIRPFLGALLQNSQLQANITPLEAVRFFAHLRGVKLDTPELLTRLGLESKSKAPFDTLSKGQQQRLLLGLALLHKPRLLVLDEPFDGLDPSGRQTLHQALREARTGGTTLLLCTHDLSDAEALCDEVCFLAEGRSLLQGNPGRLLAARALPSRITFSTTSPLPTAQLETLPLSAPPMASGGGWSLESVEPQLCIQSLTTTLALAGNAFKELHITPPGLNELYHRLHEEGAPATLETQESRR